MQQYSTFLPGLSKQNSFTTSLTFLLFSNVSVLELFEFTEIIFRNMLTKQNLKKKEQLLQQFAPD